MCIQDPNNKKELFKKAAFSQETQRALSKHWKNFMLWCEHNELNAIACTPDIIENYFMFLVENKKKNCYHRTS